MPTVNSTNGHGRMLTPFKEEELIINKSLGGGFGNGVRSSISSIGGEVAVVDHSIFGYLVLDIKHRRVVDRVSRSQGRVVGFDKRGYILQLSVLMMVKKYIYFVTILIINRYLPQLTIDN
jgi:hypothetical protein